MSESETVTFIAPAEHCGPVELDADGTPTRFDRVGGVFVVPAAVAPQFEAMGFVRVTTTEL